VGELRGLPVEDGGRHNETYERRSREYIGREVSGRGDQEQGEKTEVQVTTTM